MYNFHNENIKRATCKRVCSTLVKKLLYEPNNFVYVINLLFYNFANPKLENSIKMFYFEKRDQIFDLERILYKYWSLLYPGVKFTIKKIMKPINSFQSIRKSITAGKGPIRLWLWTRFRFNDFTNDKNIILTKLHRVIDFLQNCCKN